MRTLSPTKPISPTAASNADRPQAQGLAQILAYYSATAQDFRAWSPALNMHFGYWTLGQNPFKRESMLETMNEQVMQRLRLPAQSAARVADLGCGAGATARSIALHRRCTTVDAVTLVPAQILQGAALNQTAGLLNPVRFHLADYAHTQLASAAYDGVYALESACHAPGAGKTALLREASRLLKPGGRLVIADAMRRTTKPLPAFMASIYRQWCNNWAVSELAEQAALRLALQAEGFEDIQFEDISWRVAASALHIPLLASRFALREWWRARFKLGRLRQGHISASFAAFLLGAWLPGFGYFIVTAQKPVQISPAKLRPLPV